MTTLFISDLHLSTDRPEKLELFRQFISGPAKDADKLYILGDLFEYWVGDDDSTPPNPEILSLLRSLSEAGARVFVMHGNRDFLMGDKFEEATGATLLPDPSVVLLYGEKTLLMHGDLLCTNDTEYMKFRYIVRDPEWQKLFLEKPLQERIAMAKQLRAASKEAMKDKIPVIMDVEQETVEQFMRTHHVHRLIHGHTHRPAIHHFELDGQPTTRIVLGDWYQNENILVCNENEQKLVPVQKFLTNQ